MQLRSSRVTPVKGASQNGSCATTNGVASNPQRKSRVNMEEGGASSQQQQSRAYIFLHYTLVPFGMLTVIPNLTLILWFTTVSCDGSYTVFLQHMAKHDVIGGLALIWMEAYSQMTWDVWAVLLSYCVFALILMVAVPGPEVHGPLTPKGNIPVYKDNGCRCYVLTLISFAALTYVLYVNGLTPTVVYDKLAGYLLATNILGHILCIYLLWKGINNPTTTDSGSSGNVLFDYYWGTDLYPRVYGVDVKVFTNCRFGMTVWPLLILIYCLKSYELHGFVDSAWLSCALQLVYISKFFWWEAGYYGSIDIIVDRAGYMLCWGCLCYIPGMYASVSMYLVRHPLQLGPLYTSLILVAGTAAILVNYWADYQRQVTRQTRGKTLIWGKTPRLIHAKYELEQGEVKDSILLVSGFWAVARHFNYIPEILLAFFWSLPALFTHLMPYSYVIYLTILLTHRAYRDDEKCFKKYGKYWEKYCQLVPYKMLPGIL